MAKKFDEQEKDQIRTKLLEKGRELFGIYGLKKTNIEELTKAVGIAQGSFYLFYYSKEELYFDILEIEEESIQKEIAALISTEKPSRQLFERFLKEALKLIEENPFLRQIYLENQFELLIRKLPKERLEQHFDKDLSSQLTMIQQWQKEGLMIQERPELIISLLRGLVMLTLHKKEIGDHYEDTLNLMIRFIVNGLIPEEGQNHD